MAAENEKINQFNPKDLLTIPNIITYFRILCIPAFVVLSVFAGLNNSIALVYWALGVFAVAAASDLADGFLARKYNWGTGVGMMLDPLADKLMHISVAICLAFAIKINGQYFLHWGFIIAIMLKELIMISVAPVVAKKGILVKANMLGKVASATLSGGIILCFFHPFVNPWDWAIVLTATVQSYFAAIFYLTDIIRQSKQLKAEGRTTFKDGKDDIKAAEPAIKTEKTAAVKSVSKTPAKNTKQKNTAETQNSDK